jgi:diguanylate cyclase (GGDEF)-like protein/PAS domain S-box-containing protein
MRAAALEPLIQRLSAYGVPAAIAALTLVALIAWEPHYPPGAAAPLELRVLEDAGGALEPAQALERLAASAPVPHRDTRLSESPFWFLFYAGPADGEMEIELPSRHAVAAQCWNAQTLELLGGASRAGAGGAMRSAKAGFALALGERRAGAGVLCRATYSGPARISALQWDRAELRGSTDRFHRNAGLLDGGVLLLAAFVLVAAAINRDATYLLFAAWLVASLRLAAISVGWDMQWFERTVPPAWLAPLRQVTIAAYILLTYALFSRLFREPLRRLGHAWALHVARLCCLALLAAALALPFARFLPFMWVTAAIGIAVLGFLLFRILAVTRSPVAMWYSASLGTVLAAGLYEVVAAALGVKELIGSVNSVTAALASSLLAALAIAEQMRQERSARLRAEAELRGTYEALPIGLFTLDGAGTFLRVNPEAARMLGVEADAAGGLRWSDFFAPRAWHRPAEFEVQRLVAGEAEPRWFHVKAAPAEGKVEGSLQDMTERRRATEQLRFLAENDALTGVLNRRGIDKLLEAELGRLAPARSLALAYLDLDRFKLINDLFGHLAGDEVLRQVCRRVEELLGQGHSLGRIGGDEFVIVFAGTPIRSAGAICRGILEALGSLPYQSADKAFQVTGSIGLVEVAGGTPVSDAISMADQACRAAKGARSEGLMVYERGAPAFKEREQELRLAKHLGAGLAPEGLYLVMQPILSLHEPRASLDFEVLVRMREADGSVLEGGRIMAAAENNGRAAVIDRWVLTSTLAWLDEHREALGSTRFVCMNLSGASLNDERFVREAFALLAAHPRAAGRLCIEITESIALHDLANTRRFIDRVRGFDAKVALDDFGAGYTSFSYLKELPADALKIDGSFVRGVQAHPANLAIVEAIAELSRNLGMQSIAEWAEECATVQALREAGIDYAQGYVIARPLAPERILGARSAADFIDDEALRAFLGEQEEVFSPASGSRRPAS